MQLRNFVLLRGIEDAASRCEGINNPQESTPSQRDLTVPAARRVAVALEDPATTYLCPAATCWNRSKSTITGPSGHPLYLRNE